MEPFSVQRMNVIKTNKFSYFSNDLLFRQFFLSLHEEDSVHRVPPFFNTEFSMSFVDNKLYANNLNINYKYIWPKQKRILLLFFTPI